MADQPEREGSHDPKSELLELGRRHGRHAHQPLPQGRAPRGRQHAFRHRRQPRCLHQLQSVRPRLPRGAGQRRDRHGLPRPRLQGRVRLRPGHGAVDLRCLRRVRAGVPDGRADGEEPARPSRHARQLRDQVGRHAVPLLRRRLPDDGARQGQQDPLRRRPRRARQQQPPVRQGPLRVRLHPSPRPADQAADPPRRRRQGRQHADPAR